MKCEIYNFTMLLKFPDHEGESGRMDFRSQLCLNTV